MANANSNGGSAGSPIGPPPVDPALPPIMPYGMAPASPPKVVSPVYIIAPAPFADRFQVRPGSNLTPGFITSVLRNADIGYFWEQEDVLDEAREKDAHLHTVVGKREDQVAGAEWELRAPPGEDAARMQEIIDYETAALNRLGHFHEHIAHLTGAVFKGRAVLEVLWSKGTRTQPQEPMELYPVHGRRLAMANNWRLHLWDATSPGQNAELAHFPGKAIDEYPRGKFLVHMPRIFGGYPTREGLGRLLIWYSAFKVWTVRDWMAYAEMVGRPIRIAQYKAGGTGEGEQARDEDVAKILESLAHMSGSTPMVHPDTIAINMPNLVGRANPVHEMLTSFCDAQMSKATLGQILTTDVGKFGSRAHADVQADEQTMIARRDSRSVAETLRRDLLTPMTRAKFGNDAPVPMIFFNVDPKSDLTLLAQRLKIFVSLGGKVDQADARNMLGIPDPKPGADFLIPMIGAGGKINEQVVGDLERDEAIGAGEEPAGDRAEEDANSAAGPETNKGKPTDAREDADDAGFRETDR